MTVTDIRPEVDAPPVEFQHVVLVGVDELVPPAPDASLIVADLAPAPRPPVELGTGRGRLAASVASVTFLLLIVGVMGWYRFSDVPSLPGSSGPVPTVAITTSDASPLSLGADVEVAVGAGAAVERVDLFVDGDWTGTDTSAPFTPEWEHRSDGTHELKAKLTDADGRVRYSEPVEVTIKS